jgi:DNA-binding Lrp family transcriptional regulator
MRALGAGGGLLIPNANGASREERTPYLPLMYLIRAARCLHSIAQNDVVLHNSCIGVDGMTESERIDQFDRKILALLQIDSRLTNNDLSEQVHLSPSQCSRRRQRLEEEGYVRGYHAVLDRDRLGFSLVNVVTVTLATHNRDNARRFADLISKLPEVQEAHALTGEMDYILKVVTRDLKSLSEFVNGVLLPHDTVNYVKTAIVLETLKETTNLPL